MTITNGYATLAEFKPLLTIQGVAVSSTDDTLIEEIITDASRMIDDLCGRWFYGDTQTRLYNVPTGRVLNLDADLLAVTTLTNGDGTVLTTTDYRLENANAKPYTSIVLKQSSTVEWSGSGTDWERQISVAGSWGFVDRTATDARAALWIRNTHRACLDIALMKYRERLGTNQTGSVVVTGAGVVITPAGAVPKSAYDLISAARRRV